MQFPRLNIGQKFLGYLMFLSVIPLLVVGLTSYRNSSDVLQADARRSTTQLVENQREYLELQLSQLESLLVNVSNVDDIRNILTNEDPKAQDTYTSLSTQARVGYILSGYTNLTGLVSLDIFTVNGTHYHIGDTLDAERVRQEVKDRVLAETFQSNAPVVWFGVDDNVNVSSAYQKVLVVSKGLYKIDSQTQQSRPVAMLMASYSLQALYEHFSKIDLGDRALLIVTDAKNRIIYHPNQSLIATSNIPAELRDIKDNHMAFTASLNNTPTLVTYTRSPITGWKMAGLVPLSTFEAQTAIIGSTTILVLLLSFGIVIIAAILYNRSVVVPIRAITNQFKNLQNHPGGQQEPLPVRSRDEIGQLVQWFNAFLENLTIRQRAEKQLLEREQEREQLITRLEESLRFKDQFMATMSHELRTPLNAIQGYSGLILMEDITEDVKYMTDRILSNSRRLLSLINDVLDISRMNAQPIEIISQPMMLPDLLTAWYDDFKPQADAKGIELAMSIDPSLPKVIMGDDARLTQICANLLQNALKFTEKGMVRLAAVSGKTTWKLVVSDTGIGIPEEWQERIFDEFRQVDGSSKRKYGGAGLGLSIVKKLCLLMGGTVSVTSTASEGSAFTVTMPLNVPSAEIIAALQKEG